MTRWRKEFSQGTDRLLAVKNPKTIAVAYLVTGVLAIIGFSFYLWYGAQTGVEDSVLDWFGLGAGVVSLGLGVKKFRELGTAAPPPPPVTPTKRRIPRPGE